MHCACFARFDGDGPSGDRDVDDGISANDLISRQAMLQGLMNLDGGSSAFPFVALFYGTPSSYLW